jgi:hypothetical protein
MGMYDTVLGLPPGYDSQFKCWDCLMHEYSKGDTLPPVGIATTYSIELNIAEKGHPPAFLIVNEGVLVEPIAPDPATGAPVFDKWGKYLGHGGTMLERPEHPMEAALKTQAAMAPWTVKEGLSTKKDDAPVPSKRQERTLTHELRLREDFVVKVKLPHDLSENEAERLALWMQALPFSREGS